MKMLHPLEIKVNNVASYETNLNLYMWYGVGLVLPELDHPASYQLNTETMPQT